MITPRPAHTTLSKDVTLIYLHGGGFHVGSPTVHRELVSRLSTAANTRVYPLAPVHPFPAASDTVFSFCRKVLDSGVAPAKLVLSGNSAGAT